MPPSARQIVYVDTNVVFEAIATGCWAALVEHYDVRTVTEVRREALAGNPRAKGYILVDAAGFDRAVTVSEVSDAEIVRAQAQTRLMTQIDPGERDLLAHVAARRGEAWLLTTGDRAAIRTACALGLDTRLRSLEELAHACGQRPGVHDCFTKRWLGRVRAEFLLDHLP